MTEITEFVDTLPKQSLATMLTFFKGGSSVGKKTLALAASNVVLYAESFIPDDGPVPMLAAKSSAPVMSDTEAAKCCEDALSMHAGVGKINLDRWKSLISTLLPLLIGLL